MESILTSIKKMLGIMEDDTHFDVDIIIHINTVLGILNQLGVGVEGFTIKDKNATWNQFLKDRSVKLDGARTYTYLRVKLLFDPPPSASGVACMEKVVEELGFRLTVAADSKKKDTSKARPFWDD